MKFILGCRNSMTTLLQRHLLFVICFNLIISVLLIAIECVVTGYTLYYSVYKYKPFLKINIYGNSLTILHFFLSRWMYSCISFWDYIKLLILLWSEENAKYKWITILKVLISLELLILLYSMSSLLWKKILSKLLISN